MDLNGNGENVLVCGGFVWQAEWWRGGCGWEVVTGEVWRVCRVGMVEFR